MSPTQSPTQLNLSEHFLLEEAVVTKHTDLDNIPPASILNTIQHTAKMMEVVRSCLGNRPIRINSWYRSPEVNARVGGAFNSQHLRGEAVDFVCPSYGTPYEVAQLLSADRDLLMFDQLIYEHSWVHISFVIPPTIPRLQVLTYLPESKTYTTGIKPKR